MSNKAKKSSSTGVRYSDDQKKEVVDFVINYNTTNGRGGQSVASKKFKVTPLTISAWIKGAGKKSAAKPSKKIATKPVKKAATAKKGKAAPKGVRYNPEQKQEIVDFVNDYNAANGRGGQSQAAKKFNVSVLTVSSWLKAAGSKRSKSPKVAKGGVTKAAKSGAAVSPKGLEAKVAALVAINNQVSAAEKELEKLYAKQDAVMASFK